MFGRVAEEQSETELVECVLAGDLPGKADENFVGGGKAFPIGEPGPRIDNVNAKSRLARKGRYRDRHLTGAKDEEIRIMTDDLDKDLHLSLLCFVRRLKASVQRHCAREALRQ